MSVDIRDVITCATFCDDRLRGSVVARGRISRFPIDLRRRPYNTLALPCECVRVRLLENKMGVDQDMIWKAIIQRKFRRKANSRGNDVFVQSVNYYAQPHRVRALISWWPSSVCLSVCLSVPCLTLSREWNGMAGWKSAGRKPVTRWPVTPFHWLIQDLWKGVGAASDRRPRGVVCGEGCPSPLGLGLVLCSSPEKLKFCSWNCPFYCILRNNPTYANIMSITACNERGNSPQSVWHTFNGFSFYHCCQCHMLSDTADYGLFTAACQVVILFGGVSGGAVPTRCAPPYRKNKWNFALEIAHFSVFWVAILLMQISCL